MFEKIGQGEEESTRFYHGWVSEVQENVPKERLLIFDVKEGWGPLCKFLNLPEPKVAFPHVNDSAAVVKNFKVLKMLSRILLVYVPASIIAIIAFVFSTS